MNIDKHNSKHSNENDPREKQRTRDSQSPVRLLSLVESARYLGVSTYTVRDFIFTGLIPSVKLPHAAQDGRVIKRVLIDIKDLDELIFKSKSSSKI
jgi:hypothetical protein